MPGRAGCSATLRRAVTLAAAAPAQGPPSKLHQRLGPCGRNRLLWLQTLRGRVMGIACLHFSAMCFSKLKIGKALLWVIFSTQYVRRCILELQLMKERWAADYQLCSASLC